MVDIKEQPKTATRRGRGRRLQAPVIAIDGIRRRAPPKPEEEDALPIPHGGPSSSTEEEDNKSHRSSSTESEEEEEIVASPANESDAEDENIVVNPANESDEEEDIVANPANESGSSSSSDGEETMMSKSGLLNNYQAPAKRRRLSEDANETKPLSSNNRRGGHLRATAVEQIDMDTGEVIAQFDSISEAARAVGAAQPNISCCLSGKNRTCKGFMWRRKMLDDV
jgi:hypothetical protein